MSSNSEEYASSPQEEGIITLSEIIDLSQKMLFTLTDQYSILESLKDPSSSLDKSKIRDIYDLHSQFASVFMFLEQAYLTWKQEQLTDIQKQHLKEGELNLIESQNLHKRIKFLLDHYVPERGEIKEREGTKIPLQHMQ